MRNFFTAVIFAGLLSLIAPGLAWSDSESQEARTPLVQDSPEKSPGPRAGDSGAPASLHEALRASRAESQNTGFGSGLDQNEGQSPASLYEALWKNKNDFNRRLRRQDSELRGRAAKKSEPVYNEPEDYNYYVAAHWPDLSKLNEQTDWTDLNQPGPDNVITPKDLTAPAPDSNPNMVVESDYDKDAVAASRQYSEELASDLN